MTMPILHPRKRVELPALCEGSRTQIILERLSNLSGLSAAEKKMISIWRSPRYILTVGDRRCIRYMALIHLGEKL